MVSTLVLVGFVLTATITDIRWRKVYNGTTYTGMLVALAGNSLASVAGAEPESTWGVLIGTVGFGDSLAGWASCGFVMLVCYVFFPGGLGGGDVKLLAMMGAYLGLFRGLEALLWTFVLGGCMALIILVWQFGAWRLLTRTVRLVLFSLRFQTPPPLNDEERARLKTDLFLTPSALAAVVIVQLQLGNWL
jgi:prepilin peptidase CpaA